MSRRMVSESVSGYIDNFEDSMSQAYYEVESSTFLPFASFEDRKRAS